MRLLTLGKTGITVPQNAFGCLPIQRVTLGTAVYLLRRAYSGGMRFFDTARSYTDSEDKVGTAFEGMRDKVVIATKTKAANAEEFWSDLETSLNKLKTDHIDLYQFHFAPRCYRPGDGTGLYEAMLEAKKQGKILHMGITAHKMDVAEEIIESGLYETLQFPFSYLSSDREIALVRRCKETGMGFIAMKGLAGGLLTNPKACMAFMHEHDALPIWGVQRESELLDWLSFFEEDSVMTEEMQATIDKDRSELLGDFCRGCGYCLPCTVGIRINSCARMSQLIRRSPWKGYLGEQWQAEMEKIDQCVNCGLCKSRCPYELDTPALLRKNLEDYRNILAGKAQI